MRFTLAVAALIALGGGARAQDNPACAKYKNDFEYNACLAKIGPKAAPAHAAAPRSAPRSVARSHGRMHAVFAVEPRS